MSNRCALVALWAALAGAASLAGCSDSSNTPSNSFIEQSTQRQLGHPDRADGRLCKKLFEPEQAGELKAVRDLDGILVEHEVPGPGGEVFVVFRHSSTEEVVDADGSWRQIPGPYGYAEMVRADGDWKVCGVNEGEPAGS